MSVPSGRLQFFVLEASEYLERLARIADQPSRPDGDELVRLTRALRGTALMAGLAAFAQAAAGLERLAKTHRDNPATWSVGRAEMVAGAVEELKRLTRKAGGWSDQDSDAAARLGRDLANSLGEAPAQPAQASETDDDLKPSVRSFVAREGAVIAGTLEHAAQALELGQPGAAAEAILPRLQSLRGLAALPRLSPLPEFLDAIELTIRSVHESAVPPDGPMALRRAAVAVTRLVRDIAELGQASGDTPEIILGAVSLLEAFGRDDDVVDIASLYRDHDPAPIVSKGEPPERDATDAVLEIVSLADRFRQASDQMSVPSGRAGRTLTLYSLLVQLRPLTQEAPRERPHLAGLLQAVGQAIGGGHATRHPAAFGAALRQAADRLSEAAETRNAIFLGDELAPVVQALAALPALAEPPSAEPPSAENRIVPIESLAPDELTRFEESFSTYHRLQSTAPVGRPPAPEDLEVDVVPIGSLLYRGRTALLRADDVRRELSAGLKRNLPFGEIEPLVSELIDLVPLALED